MNKTFFPFFILFLVVLVLGCIGGGGGDLGPETSAAGFTKGNIEGLIKINGIESTEVSLISNQRADVVLTLMNNGTVDMKNIEGRAIGCLEDVGADDPTIELLEPRDKDLLIWTVQAPTLGETEKLSCPLILRTCFEQESSGQTDITVIPPDSREVGAPTTFTKGDNVGITFNVGQLRLVEGSCRSGDSSVADSACLVNKEESSCLGATNCEWQEPDHTTSGSVIIQNIGPGWIDYPEWWEPYNDPNLMGTLGLNQLKSIHINITAEKDGLELKKLSEEAPSKYSGALGLSPVKESKTNKDIARYELSYAESTVDAFLLKLVGGKERSTRLVFDIDNPAVYSQLESERLSVSTEFGYCIDLATVNVKLTGR